MTHQCTHGVLIWYNLRSKCQYSRYKVTRQRCRVNILMTCWLVWIVFDGGSNFFIYDNWPKITSHWLLYHVNVLSWRSRTIKVYFFSMSSTIGGTFKSFNSDEVQIAWGYWHAKCTCTLTLSTNTVIKSYDN